MRFLLFRLQRLLIVFFAVTLLTFLLVNVLPGDVAYDIAGQDASEEDVQAIRADLGLDRPVLIRYADWLSSFLVGDWGISYRTGEPVVEAIFSRFPVSLQLMLMTQLIALCIAVPAAFFSALRPGSFVDRGIAASAFMSLSVPSFMASIVLILVFALHLDLLPATGYVPITEDFWHNIAAFVLPAMSIALAEFVVLMRVLRADLISVLQEDYIAMARAKGLPTARILLLHALRPASFSTITILGLQIGNLIGGAIIVETIFALPGVGRLLINAIYARDFLVVQGAVTFIAFAYVLVNFTVDLLYLILDPRIRTEKAHG
ncbi:MAG: ABC transporter permease subunit [Gammaproteobacteria bacterium]|nr:ABC transporter permease subunit [Gammaproteobacteria bacterium]